MEDQTEIIKNQDGSVYHLGLLPEDISDIIFLVGDPDRVSLVSNEFDKVYIKKQKRELITHTGTLNNRIVSCISTGMGIDNIEIVVTELNHLFKCNPNNFQNPYLTLVRIGTCGSVKKYIKVGEMVISTSATGFDTLNTFYNFPSSPSDLLLSSYILEKTGFNIPVYSALCNSDILGIFPEIIFRGNTATMPGFYHPQGRHLGLKGNKLSNNILNILQENPYMDFTNIEMETSCLYMLSQLFGHKALSTNAILANRVTGEFIKDYQSSIIKMIQMVTDTLTKNYF